MHFDLKETIFLRYISESNGWELREREMKSDRVMLYRYGEAAENVEGDEPLIGRGGARFALIFGLRRWRRRKLMMTER